MGIRGPSAKIKIPIQDYKFARYATDGSSSKVPAAEGPGILAVGRVTAASFFFFFLFLGGGVGLPGRGGALLWTHHIRHPYSS